MVILLVLKPEAASMNEIVEYGVYFPTVLGSGAPDARLRVPCEVCDSHRSELAAPTKQPFGGHHGIVMK
jgi:hypothetical protein